MNLNGNVNESVHMIWPVDMKSQFFLSLSTYFLPDNFDTCLNTLLLKFDWGVDETECKIQ